MLCRAYTMSNDAILLPVDIGQLVQNAFMLNSNVVVICLCLVILSFSVNRFLPFLPDTYYLRVMLSSKLCTVTSCSVALLPVQLLNFFTCYWLLLKHMLVHWGVLQITMTEVMTVCFSWYLIACYVLKWVTPELSWCGSSKITWCFNNLSVYLFDRSGERS